MKINKERWLRFTIAQQMGNIAAEIVRARKWDEEGDQKACNGALERIFNYIDCMIDDPKWRSPRTRLRELLRFREVLGAWYGGCKEDFGTSVSLLPQYCLCFAIQARRE